jgi:serine/threonine protein kinase
LVNGDQQEWKAIWLSQHCPQACLRLKLWLCLPSSEKSSRATSSDVAGSSASWAAAGWERFIWALKILSPALSMENPGLAERFIREAQLAARIRHPNVIAVMDAAHDESTGLYFIVMEYIGGGSLTWHLRHGPLPEAKALNIITGIAHALVVAEECRIVHRDIKPDNIMLDLRGTAKLADLGLAKHSLDSRVSLTLGGSFIGTPAYMSPEQARDAKVADTRDDIYSLGASFYECLTGEPPFQGETPYNIMSELLTKPSPMPRASRPEISSSVDLICRKMMAKTRDLRYADARALLEDLQHAQKFGDSGLDRLEAASFDRDSVKAHQQGLSYGVETSSDGVYAEPESSHDLPKNPLPRTAFVRSMPRRSEPSVLGVGVLLVTMVAVVAIIFAWAGTNHPLSYVETELGLISPQLKPQPVKLVPAKEKEHTHLASTHPSTSLSDSKEKGKHLSPSTTNSAPAVSEGTSVSPGQVSPPVVVPVALPVDNTTATNSVPALPVNPASLITPAISSDSPDSAFVARDIAEKSLPPGDIAPTGKAELLRIIGERNENQASPPVWKYYFFDKEAAGHARIVTVGDGKTIKDGEDLADFATPYQEQHILPEDKLLIDSTQALQIAQGLIPDAPVSSSELVLLQQKNSVPMWKVTLWSRTANGDQRKMGEVTLLAENGTLISKNLK